MGITRLQEKVDKTFRPHGPNGYRLSNDNGYMVEFIRPLPRPFNRKMPGAEPLESDDVTAVPLDGLQWLVNAPDRQIVIDARGFPAPLSCPDLHTLAERKAEDLGIPMERRIFPEGGDGKGELFSSVRWPQFKHFSGREMIELPLI